MRGDISAGTEQLLSSISIHASTWEAAASEHCSLILSTHFNSRLYMRGSLSQGTLSQSPPIFQFTPLHERQRTKNERRSKQHISIHASTWEAATTSIRLWVVTIFQFTPLHERQPLRRASRHIDALFQFTPLHERQQYDQLLERLEIKFQFTPLHERQLRKVWCKDGWANFNSRLYMRGSWRCLHTFSE